MSRPKLLFLVACPATFAEIIPFLGASGFDVAAQAIEDSVRGQVLVGRPELVVIEHSNKALRGALDAAGEIRKINSAISVLIATTEGSEELAIGTLRAGLQDYVRLPASPASFLARIQKHLPSLAAPLEAAENADQNPNAGRMVAASESVLTPLLSKREMPSSRPLIPEVFLFSWPATPHFPWRMLRRNTRVSVLPFLRRISLIALSCGPKPWKQ